MSTTQVGVLIDALVATLTTALPAVTVVDGPALQAPGIGRDALYIGWGGDEGDDEAANAAQEWGGLGKLARKENMSVTCRAQASRGDKAMKPTRDAALAIVEATETALRTDPTLGVLPGPGWAAFAGVDRLIEQQTGQGSRCGVVFTITAFARI